MIYLSNIYWAKKRIAHFVVWLYKVGNAEEPAKYKKKRTEEKKEKKEH